MSCSVIGNYLSRFDEEQCKTAKQYYPDSIGRDLEIAYFSNCFMND